MECTWFHGPSCPDGSLTLPQASRTIDFGPISNQIDMRATPTCVFVSGCLLVAATASYAQSLADVARKEEERRKTQPAAAKVYTNKDLGDVPPAATPAPAPVSGGLTTASSSEGSTGSGAAKERFKGRQRRQVGHARAGLLVRADEVDAGNARSRLDIR